MRVYFTLHCLSNSINEYLIPQLIYIETYRLTTTKYAFICILTVIFTEV